MKVSISELRKSWRRYLDRITEDGPEIVITRYGKPVAKLVPYGGGSEEERIFGYLAGTVTVHSDIVSPSGEKWTADEL